MKIQNGFLLKVPLMLSLFLLSSSAIAEMIIPMFFTSEQGVGKVVGTVEIKETKYGLLFIPNLHGLKPGIHGFHIHQNPNCEKNGTAAGGHLDPQNAGKHLGPYNDGGHLGDLPALYVTEEGSATLPVLAPRIKNIDAVKSHSLMIHERGDNYSDTPEKLGGSGTRVVCGVIK